MTLPFRRRHNDAEATHDRARALSSRRFLEPLEGDDEAWLDHHLDACTECARDDAAYAADRELLRSLRDKPIEPPRDLWAKTSAALDIAAARRSPPAGLRNRPFWRLAPAGAVAGVAVLLVVIGASLLPGNPTVPGQGTTPPIAQASGSAPPEPTPIIITAAEIPVLRPGVGGSFDFSLTDVPAVCPQTRPECVPPPSEHAQTTVPLVGLKVSTLTLAPGNDQLVYESVGGTSGEGKILIVPLKPSGTASPPPASPSASPTETAGETVVPSEPAESEGPTPEPTPTGQIEIASGVSLVGEVGYSADGAWLAFSAAPSDGSTGPDLYVYAKGGSAATKVTDDHQTYFSAWLGNRILASRVVVPVVEPVASASPEASVEPSPEASLDPGASAAPPEPIEAGSTSFVFDPATGTSQDLAQADVWMPTVDPTSRFITYEMIAA